MAWAYYSDNTYEMFPCYREISKFYFLKIRKIQNSKLISKDIILLTKMVGIQKDIYNHLKMAQIQQKKNKSPDTLESWMCYWEGLTSGLWIFSIFLFPFFKFITSILLLNQMLMRKFYVQPEI